MSRSIDLFIDSDRPIDEVAADVERLTGLSLTACSDGATWSLEEGSVRVELRRHPYVDDGDLVLEHYQYAMSARVGNEVRLVDAPETNLLRMVSDALQRGGVPALLVHDLQYRDRTTSAGAHAAAAPDAESAS